MGYTWLELGRRDDDGGEHYLMLGCGLHAVEGRGLTAHWFFITPRCVGQDLFLQSPVGSALSAPPCRMPWARGAGLPPRGDYRLAVYRAVLYEGLVNLLIELRQPQFSRQLDEKRLSNPLRDALPRASGSLLDDVADTCRSVDDDRTALKPFTAARDGAHAFLTEYGRYARIAARLRAEALRTAHSRYEHAMAALCGGVRALDTSQASTRVS